MLTTIQSVLADPHIGEAIESVATKTALATSAVTVIGGITLDDWALIIGIIGTIITVSFNIWFKLHYRKNRRQNGVRK